MEDALGILPQTISTGFAPLAAPLPYFPGLGKLLSGVTISLVVCYLEIHHPAPPADLQSFTGPANPPIYLDCDQAAAELGVSRRTLHIAFACLGVFWLSDAQRERAARAGREFLNPIHTTHGKIKIYSYVGTKNYNQPRTIALRRNLPQLQRTLNGAGLSICRTVPDSHFVPIDQTPASEQLTDTLPLILESVCGIGGDRRSSRWERWRKGREIRKKS